MSEQTNAPTEHDELARLIESGYDKDETPCPYDHAPEIAAEILSAGYRKPRTVTTYAELDVLPDDSVILDELDGPLIKVGSWFHSPTDEMKSSSVILPATVLYEPKAAA